MSKIRIFFRFLRYLFPFRCRWGTILLLSGSTALLGLVNPFLTKLMIDRAIGNKDMRLFLVLALACGLVLVFEALTQHFKQFLEKQVKLRVGFDLNRKIYKKIQSFPLSWFKDRSTGEHLYKINHDLDRVTDFITDIPPQIVSIFPQLFLTLGIVFSLNRPLALFSLCLAPVLYLPSWYLVRKMQALWLKLIERLERVFRNLEEVFSHIQLVKAFCQESASTRKHLRMLTENVRAGMVNVRLEVFFGFISQVLSKVIAGLIAFYGIYQVIRGQLTFGTFAAVMVYMNKLMGLQWQFNHFFQATAVGLVSCERVAKILDEPLGVFPPDGTETVIFRSPDIFFDRVSFGYPSGEVVLKNLSFKFENGKHTALAGPSGCGKTTILNLILRLYEPSAGSVFVGGHPLRELKLSALRRQIGIALQEPFLWNDTIANNIKYGKAHATPEEVLRVACLAGIDVFVGRLPLGYETVIGENACKLSEGQKQRIAIARALIRDPQILILDEAMSSLDSASEEKILSRIKDLRKGMTLLTVSHRLSAVVHADLVCYLQSSERLIIDAPTRLLQANREFTNLFGEQGNIAAPA